MDRLLDNVFSFRGPKSLGYVSIPSEIYLLSNCDTHHDSETGFGTRVLSFLIEYSKLSLTAKSPIYTR